MYAQRNELISQSSFVEEDVEVTNARNMDLIRDDVDKSYNDINLLLLSADRCEELQ